MTNEPGTRPGGVTGAIKGTIEGTITSTKPDAQQKKYPSYELVLMFLLPCLVVLAFIWIFFSPLKATAIFLGSSGATIVTAVIAVGIERIIEVIWWTHDRDDIKKDLDIIYPRRLIISAELGALIGLIIVKFAPINLFFGGSTPAALPFILNDKTTLISIIQGNLGIAITGLLAGLVAVPAHEVIQAISNYKNAQKGS